MEKNRDNKTNPDTEPGQLRLRYVPAEKGREVANSIRKALGAMKGVERVRINPFSGSVLIHQDSQGTDLETILNAVRQMDDLKDIQWQSLPREADSTDPPTVQSLTLRGEMGVAIKRASFQIASNLYGPGTAFGLSDGSIIPQPVKVHVTPGRMRLKVPELKGNKPLGRQIEKILKNLETVRHVHARPLTGSLVIKFHGDSLSPAMIIKLLQEQGCFCRGMIETIEDSDEYRDISGPIVRKVIGRTARKTAAEAVNRLFSIARKIISNNPSLDSEVTPDIDEN